MDRFVFTIHLAGVGETQREAWEDAVEAFTLDPGMWHDCEQDLDEWRSSIENNSIGKEKPGGHIQAQATT